MCGCSSSNMDRKIKMQSKQLHTATFHSLQQNLIRSLKTCIDLSHVVLTGVCFTSTETERAWNRPRLCVYACVYFVVCLFAFFKKKECLVLYSSS